MASMSLLLCYRDDDVETIKRLTKVQNVTVLTIPERLQFKIFSCRPTMLTGNTFQCSMAPPL